MTAFRFAVLALCLTVAACRTTTIYNVQHAPLMTRQAVTRDDVAEVIRNAARRKGWTVEDVAPGEMRAMITRRRHTAVVAIHYDTGSFSIDYVGSTNLKHQGDTIHKAYNGWVRNLEEEIKREAAFRLQ